ncbi:peptide chain release factor N(5)-glutamine methyltransferase [Carboxydothermus hydrogenoformans]|uniref:Release factor glutamine methyltransferase n=1 Tax=Carboxydothermus hydrogenoformans (strain ATCC BAA-161 / DSM 6008 / Z-2901) TaxID=246194 RepID=Q3A929_CARHZ|nr:peptide chain release factor N(5)-glutamine methyltransferase [Carboxydothermus hydrogenoformans]ABB14651.1 modification methylase, HemK family [Carboxydothermus hydrogenoformans Z-2901]
MPKTLREALLWAKNRLTSAGIEMPALDAELLLAHVLGISRVAIYTRPERVLSEYEWERFVDHVERRASRIPLAYLIGKKEFYGLDFFVTPEVLIPRPETELMVEEGINFLRQYRGLKLVADVGTGSGAVGVALACHIPLGLFFLLDISEEALKVARVNAHHHGVDERVILGHGDLLEPLSKLDFSGKFSLITANLPYIPTEELSTLMPEVQKEPQIALDGGEDGLMLYRRLLPEAHKLLAEDGVMLLEIAPYQGKAITAEAEKLYRVEIKKDLAGHDRLVILRKR